jgi:hypothetical protein
MGAGRTHEDLRACFINSYRINYSHTYVRECFTAPDTVRYGTRGNDYQPGEPAERKRSCAGASVSLNGGSRSCRLLLSSLLSESSQTGDGGLGGQGGRCGEGPGASSDCLLASSALPDAHSLSLDGVLQEKPDSISLSLLPFRRRGSRR